MMEYIIDAFIDSLKLVPLLFVIYVLIEIVEHRYAHKIKNLVERAGKSGPAFGALAGSIPQCGFSVMSSALYAKRYITIGTLLAVFISTSDEAIPIILSDPTKAFLVVPLIIAKIIIALIVGFSVDAILKKGKNPDAGNTQCLTETGCCGHAPDSDKLTLKKTFKHPFIHTIKIFAYIFVVTLVLNMFVAWGEKYDINRLLFANSAIQPIMAAIFGLIPNCATSVAIAKLYLDGAISFGSTVAGLSTGAGLGLLVLWRENKDKKDTLKIILLLVIISSICGILLQYFYA